MFSASISTASLVSFRLAGITAPPCVFSWQAHIRAAAAIKGRSHRALSDCAIPGWQHAPCDDAEAPLHTAPAVEGGLIGEGSSCAGCRLAPKSPGRRELVLL